MGALSRARLAAAGEEKRRQAAGGLAVKELALLLGENPRQQERTDGVMAKSMEKMCTIIVDSYRCNACGGCVELCPENFTMDDASGTARETRTRAVRSRDLEEAAAFCPRKCIDLVDEG